MISLDEYKKSLGEEAGKLSSQEIEELKDRQEKLADALFDMMFTKINHETPPEGQKKANKTDKRLQHKQNTDRPNCLMIRGLYHNL